MHIIRTELTRLVVWYHLRVSISILSRVIEKKILMTLNDLARVIPPVGVRIDLLMIFAYDFDRVLFMKYNAVIRVPLRAIVLEIFAKNDFL